MRALKAVTVASTAALVMAVLSSCSGGSTTPSAATTTPSGTTQTTSASGTTTSGTQLKLGTKAVVRFKASKRHNSLIKLSVTRVRKGTIADLKQFELNGQTRRSTIYYVSTRLTNLGPDELSGQKITLYGQVSNKLVVPPVVLGSTFPACNYTALPKHFTKGKSARGCMVMFAPHHGTISQVQWRAANDSEPISWTVR